MSGGPAAGRGGRRTGGVAAGGWFRRTGPLGGRSRVPPARPPPRALGRWNWGRPAEAPGSGSADRSDEPRRRTRARRVTARPPSAPRAGGCSRCGCGRRPAERPPSPARDPGRRASRSHPGRARGVDRPHRPLPGEHPAERGGDVTGPVGLGELLGERRGRHREGHRGALDGGDRGVLQQGVRRLARLADGRHHLRPDPTQPGGVHRAGRGSSGLLGRRGVRLLRAGGPDRARASDRAGRPARPGRPTGPPTPTGPAAGSAARRRRRTVLRRGRAARGTGAPRRWRWTGRWAARRWRRARRPRVRRTRHRHLGQGPAVVVAGLRRAPEAGVGGAVLGDGRAGTGRERPARSRGGPGLQAPLDALETLHQRGVRRRGRGQQHPRAHQLQQQPRRGGAPHLGQRGVHQLGVPRQGCGTEALGLVDHPLELVRGDVDQPLLPRVGHGVHEDQVTQALQEVGGEAARVVPRLDEPVDGAEHRGPVVRAEGVDDVVEDRDVGDPQQADRPRVGDPCVVRAGEQLVEHRERVTRRPAARPDHQRVDRGLDRDALVRADPLEQPAQRARRQQAERVVVGARPDRRQHLVRLRRREDEDQVLGRLLDDLEQRVERRRGHHVRLVDDEDAVARADRREVRAVAQLARVVDAVVAGGVHLGDVERARGRSGRARCRTRRRRTGPASGPARSSASGP